MKSLNLGNIAVTPPLALAPMVGLSHTALRQLTMGLGGVGLLYTEMLSAKRLPSENESISPFLARSSNEGPLIYQIYTSDPEEIPPAINRIEELGGDGVDLNLGCPAPNMRWRGAGSYLSTDRPRLKSVLQQMRKNTNLPLTAKIRIGNIEDYDDFTSYCKFLEDMGLDCITLHTRLNNEKFCRKPRWEWGAVAKKAVNIPVFVNGGIFSVEDALKCLEQSGADGLMLGRGAVINPFLFQEISEKVYGETVRKKVSGRDIYFKFIDLVEGMFQEDRRIGRIKQFTALFAESFAFGHGFAAAVQRSKSLQEIREKAESFFSHNNK